MKISNRGKGLLWSVFGVILISPDALLIRLSNLNDFTLVFYRGILPPITIMTFLIILYKKNLIKAFLTIGYAGIYYALLYSIIHIAFIYSIQNTSVANTLVLIASAPIFAAIFSFFVLKEKPELLTLIIVCLALFSISIIGWGSYTTKGLFGDILALITGICMAASAVLVRYYKDKDLVPACIIGCLLTAIYAIPFSPEYQINFYQIINILIMCLIILPIPFIIMTIAPRYAPAYEIELIFLLESILGSLWVWYIIKEKPAINTIIGGSMLLISVFLFIIIVAKRESRFSE